METLGNQKVAKSCNNQFVCCHCDYNTSRKSSFDKHILTRKHQKVANGNTMETKKLQNETQKLQKVAKSCNQTEMSCITDCP